MTRRLRIISFLAAIGCFAAAAGISYLGFEVWPPSATLADGRSVLLPPADIQVCIRARGLAWLIDRSGEAYWRACHDWLSRHQALTGFELRFWSIVGTGLAGLVALLVFACSLRLDSISLKILRGARLQADQQGLRAFARAAAAECQVHGKGVALVPSVPLGREREARHFLIVGSVGGGKTQTMLHLISEALVRGDGLLVLDTKGDMMGGLPADGDPLLVAPHDRRSLIWDVAADCSIKQDARELAARFIPPSSDPMWSHAAQEIFVAMIVADGRADRPALHGCSQNAIAILQQFTSAGSDCLRDVQKAQDLLDRAVHCHYSKENRPGASQGGRWSIGCLSHLPIYRKAVQGAVPVFCGRRSAG